MPVRIVTADERLSAAHNKTSVAIFGPPGVGKTTLLKTLPAEQTVCLDLEAGMKSVQDWPGVVQVDTQDGRQRLTLAPGADPRELLRQIVDRGLPVDRFERATASLDEVFVTVVKGQSNGSR